MGSDSTSVWQSGPASELRPDIPHPARMYDYYLGGKDNFPADRVAAEQVIAAYPTMRESARANRAWLGRAVRYAAGQGIRQFLDIGTGIPTSGNTHEVAHSVTSEARVLYVDNDPIVLTHARALLAGMDPHAKTRVMRADLRTPKVILDEARGFLDLDQPVALMLVAILHFLIDEDDPASIVSGILSGLAPGSMLLLTHATGDFSTPEAMRRTTGVYENSTARFRARTREEILPFFSGTELVDPGLVQLPWWRPEQPLTEQDAAISGYAGVGIIA